MQDLGAVPFASAQVIAALETQNLLFLHIVGTEGTAWFVGVDHHTIGASLTPLIVVLLGPRDGSCGSLLGCSGFRNRDRGATAPAADALAPQDCRHLHDLP